MTLQADLISPAFDINEDTLCAHCHQPVPGALIDPAADHQFCCTGCQAVFQTLAACGLADYYRLRDAIEFDSKPATPKNAKFESFDSETFHNLYVQSHPDGSRSTDLILESVQCAACVWLLERLPRICEGILKSRLSLREATLRTTWNPAQLPLSQIARTLDKLGYTPHPARGVSSRDLHHKESRKRLIHLGVAGALMGNTMLLALALYSGDAGHMQSQYRLFFRILSAVLGTISLAWPGAIFFKNSLTAIRTKTINLDVPIALALAVGGIAGLINVITNRGDVYFDSLSVLVFLLLVGRFIQYRQQRRADDAVGLLFSLTPSTCRIVRDGAVTESPIEALTIDDTVEVPPGDLFPADGVVTTGSSSVNQSLLTGESLPFSVTQGSQVHAGSQNLSAPLRVRVTSTGADTRVGKLMHLIERGIQEKPPIVQFADKVGSWFLIAVTLAAAATFVFWSRHNLTHAIDHTVALLIVTCPCVLGLATPLTLAIAIGKLARRDILVKSAAALEKLSQGGTAFLDKTGTLTEGKLQLLDWIGDESLKPAVGELERHSTHPIAKALSLALKSTTAQLNFQEISETNGGITCIHNNHQLHVGSPRYIASHHIPFPAEFSKALTTFHAQGATVVLIAHDKEVRALAALADQLRPDTADAIAQLRRLNWTPKILSGDAQPVVDTIARELSIQSPHANLTPEQKLEIITRPPTPRHAAAKRSAAAGSPTLMIGDGINDGAALAAADVGIAVHGGAEASLSAADIYIARPGLSPVVDLIQTARLAMRTIHRNLLISLAYNLLAGVLAALGIMTPMIAAIIMPVSSATVLSLAIASINRRSAEASPALKGA